MFTLTIAEAALETVPPNIADHPSVRRHASQRHSSPSELLLDVSLHYGAMRGLKDGWRRGRPDIIHISLLSALATPLYQENLLRVYVHTLNDKIIEVGSKVRLPKSYHRFEGLVRQLVKSRQIRTNGNTLLSMRDGTLLDLIASVKPKRTMGLSKVGELIDIGVLADRLVKYEDVMVVVGGFSRGHFSENTRKLLDEVFAIHRSPLEAHTVVSRIIYEYEKRFMNPATA